MSRIDRVRVVVPARDEERLVGRCLESVHRSVAELAAAHPGVSCSVTVVLDACRDDTERVVRGFGDVEAVATTAGAVGVARALGVESACRGDDPDRTWVSTTDADTEVPAHWLTTQVDLATQGYDLIVGSVSPEPGDLDPRALAHWWARHRIGEGHAHVHGANLGFLLAAYREAGGYEPVRRDEDVRLVRAIRATGRAHVATARMQVTTSGRCVTRAPGGFGSYLQALPGAGGAQKTGLPPVTPMTVPET